MLILDDSTADRAAIETTFRGEGFDVRVEGDEANVERVVRSFQPHVAILDVREPAAPASDVKVRQLRQIGDIPIVLISSAASLEGRLTSFRAGVDGYLSKPFSMAELLARIQILLRRSATVSGFTYQISDLILIDRARTVSRHGMPIELTRMEYELLLALCRSSGRVLSKAELLRQLWGKHSHDDNVVEVCLNRLRRKLEAHGPRLIHTVRGVGYALSPRWPDADPPPTSATCSSGDLQEVEGKPSGATARF